MSIPLYEARDLIRRLVDGIDGNGVTGDSLQRLRDEADEWLGTQATASKAPPMQEQVYIAELRECQAALSALLGGEPNLISRVCGSTTLGNRLVHVRAALSKAEAA